MGGVNQNKNSVLQILFSHGCPPYSRLYLTLQEDFCLTWGFIALLNSCHGQWKAMIYTLKGHLFAFRLAVIFLKSTRSP